MVAADMSDEADCVSLSSTGSGDEGVVQVGPFEVSLRDEGAELLDE